MLQRLQLGAQALHRGMVGAEGGEGGRRRLFFREFALGGAQTIDFVALQAGEREVGAEEPRIAVTDTDDGGHEAREQREAGEEHSALHGAGEAPGAGWAVILPGV